MNGSQWPDISRAAFQKEGASVHASDSSMRVCITHKFGRSKS
jgi:hypothetical protein